MCVPGAGGDPTCGGNAGPAAIGGGAGGDVQVGGGNPINLVTGDKYQLETDFEPLPGVLGLELRRHYNSMSSHAGLVGAGWHMSYETVLYDFGTQVEIVQADGQRLTFHRGVGSRAALCTAARPQDGQVDVVVDAQGQTSYVWRWPDGRELSFSGGSGGGHPLQTITASSGERLTIAYSPAGDLVQVRDPQGRKLDFVYDARHVLQAIDTPVGRFSYKIDAQGRLVQVATATRIRLYHYEDRYNGGHPTALTGISLGSRDSGSQQWHEQRLSTYAYRNDGRAILTTKGEPRRMEGGKQVAGTGIEQLDVDYVDKALPGEERPDPSGEVQPRRFGKTIITNSLGQKSELLSAVIGGHYRLMQMTGPGCSTCGPSNMRYTYNARGQVLRVIRLDEAGKPKTAVVEDYDAFGRFVRESVQTDAGAKSPMTRWVRRYDYVDTHFADGSIALAAQPSLMATPSVAGGKEHVVRFKYNAFGQRLSASEEGYMPGDDHAAAPTLVRTTRFSYTMIHGRSVLTRIDGPLPNGPRGDPSDSDVTELRYDEQGDQVVAVISPGGGVMRTEGRDAAGRIARVVVEDAGRRLRRDITYDADGHESTLEETAWLRGTGGQVVENSRQHRVTRYEHDALGQMTALVRPDGTRLTTIFDLAGQPVRLIAPDGGFVELERDTESHVVAAMRHASASSLVQTLRFQRSAEHFDRVDGLSDDLGSIAQFDYPEDADEAARPTDVTHASGAHTRYTYDETDTIVTQTLASGTADALERHFDVDVNSRTTRIEDRAQGGTAVLDAQAALYDDFGRKLVYASPVHGVTRYVWDAADRLVARVSQDRHVHRLAYDAAGRVVATGVDRAPALTVYGYAGSELAEVRDTVDGQADHTKEVRQIHRDAFGRAIRTIHWLADVRGATMPSAGPLRGRLTSTERHYDDAGRLAWKSIIDAQQREHRIDYRWDGASGHLAGLSFNGKPVVTDIQGTWLGGATSIAWADGIHESSARDVRGRLIARVVQSETKTLLDQQWQYDAANRLERRRTDATTQTYAYDWRNRVVGQKDDGPDQRFAFDAVDNRMADVVGGQGRRFMYRSTGLVAVEPRDTDPGWLDLYDARGATLAMQPILSATATHVALLDTRSRPIERTGFETTVPVKYTWGVDGARLSKTVAGHRTWYHYENDDAAGGGVRLSAEGADDGAIVTHYVYADGRMVARIDTPEEPAGIDGAWMAAKRIALGWIGRRPFASAHFYAVHVDQRGAVVALSDQADGLVWRARYDAYGTATVSIAKVTMNVRLAGQYFDPETRTNDNVQREYQPSTGRYLSADPISTNAWLDLDDTSRLAGVNPYAYVSDDPLGHSDSQGLYESDVHYYMTYFLAIVAGMSSTDARMMALATQFVDDDATTAPVPPGSGTWDQVVSMFSNQKMLKDYHFALSDARGQTLQVFKNPNVDININESPQLTALRSYATPSTPGSCNMPNNKSLQFMGEFLHTYEDTFAHRDTDNMPYNATFRLFGSEWELGTGHGTGGNNPDFTYNHTDILGRVWNNENRTFVMESAVYSNIVSYMDTMNYANFQSNRGTQTIDFRNNVLQSALHEFNAYPASEEGGSLENKIKILDNALHQLGYNSLDETWHADRRGNSTDGGYNMATARENRFTNFSNLNQNDYPNAILQTTSAP